MSYIALQCHSALLQPACAALRYVSLTVTVNTLEASGVNLICLCCSIQLQSPVSFLKYSNLSQILFLWFQLSTVFCYQVLSHIYCIALHCIALHYIKLHCIALYCIALHCIVLTCIVLYCIVLYCIVLYSSIYEAPLNSHGQTEASLVRLAPSHA